MPKIELTEKNLKIQEDTIKQLIKDMKCKDLYIEEARKMANSQRDEIKGLTIVAGILFFSLIWCLYKLSN